MSAKDRVRVRVIDLDQNLRAKDTLRLVKPKNITLERCEYSESILCRRVPPFTSEKLQSDLLGAADV